MTFHQPWPYLVQPALNGNGFTLPLAIFPSQLQQPPDLEFISMSEIDSINQLLVERGLEYRMDALVHVFLPKKTPQRLQPDLERIEASLLTNLVNCTEDILNAYNRDFEWKTIFALKEWRRLQLLMEFGTDIVFSKALSNALWNLPTGQKLPLYIRKQNCALIFSKVSKSFKIETFQPSLPSEQIMTTMGSIALQFPHTVDITENVELLCSQPFIQQIRDLALNDYETSMPKIKKGGQDFAENRDVPLPFLVTELVVGMLAADPVGESDMADVKQNKITKKVRDTVEWDNCVVPFRRSGMWMSAKVILQLCLLEEMDEMDAKLMYKMILLRIICGFVNFRAQVSPCDWDLMHQMLAKLGRRAKKLSELIVKNKTLVDLKQNILKDAYQTVTGIQSKMNFLWTGLCSEEDGNNIHRIARPLSNFQNDLNHEIILLDEYLRTPMRPIREEEHDGVNDIISITRWRSMEKIMRSEIKYGGGSLKVSSRNQKTDENLDDELVWLHDVENVDISSDSDWSSAEIYTLLIKYIERATKRYSSGYHDHDPVSFSRLVITVLNLYKRLDEIATEKHPLLLEYSTGIDTSILQKLVCADGPKDLMLIDCMEKYFNRRYTAAKHNNIIFQSDINRSSFSVRFAKDCKEMTKLREEILQDTEVATKRKLSEVDMVKKQCEEMEKELLTLEHIYDETTGLHLKDCSKCTLTKSWNKRKHSVRVYEKPLPREPNLQYALVFELMIPLEISCLRDALVLITKELLGFEEGVLQLDNTTISTNWLGSYKPMKEYLSSSFRYPELVQIGSLSKPVSNSHYKTNQDIFVVPEEHFIVENGMSCVLYRCGRKLKEYNNQMDPFSFQIGATGDEEKLYKNMQFAISGTEHGHNYVIAEQHLLNFSALPSSEYLAFGSLRSGHRIQLRNLYKFLSEKSLNIERETVLALVLQTIWSAGPLERVEYEEDELRSLLPPQSRIGQSDFCSVPFAEEFLKLLENIIKVNSHNWSSPLTILTPISIIIQILKFNDNESVRSTCTSLLRKCRVTVEGWVQTVQDQQLSLVPEHDPVQKKNEQLFLKAKILEMLICSAFTFHASDSIDNNNSNDILKMHLLQTSADLRSYLKVLSGLHYYVNVEKIHEKLTPFVQILLQMTRQRIPLNLEACVHQKIRDLGATSSTLMNFVHSNWNKYSTSSTVKSNIWKSCSYPDKKHVYQGQIEYLGGKSHKIHVDIIGGALLVDSYPPTHLPSSISHDPLFQRYFGTQYGDNFKVQRDATTFTTPNKINQRHYLFFQAGYKGRLLCICRELLENEQNDGDGGDSDEENNYLELLDPEIFRGTVASPFVENYTHWLNPRTKEVYFRKKAIIPMVSSKQTTESVSAPTLEMEWDYKMIKTEIGWKLIQQGSGRYVMAIMSTGYKLLSEILLRIEEWRYINVLMSTENANTTEEKLLVSVSLPRLGLNFRLVGGLLHSVEYPDYYISLNQSKGTFVGLKNALLLEKDTEAEVIGRKQLIMVPHGIIGNDGQSHIHHFTVINSNTDSLRQPPFFVFEVDQTLRRLKADKNKSAWLYLAALHGATASCLPDPFTGLTGVEMAVWILQSGMVWSCAPYDFECKRTLQMIQDFSPSRQNYPINRQLMEKVMWVPSFPTYAAFDGYEIIIQKLLRDSERLDELFPLQNKKSVIDGDLYAHSPKLLRLRAYLRHQDMYNPCAYLSEEYIPSSYRETQATQVQVKKTGKINGRRQKGRSPCSMMNSTNDSLQPQLTVRKAEVLSVLREISLIRSKSQSDPSYCFSPPNADLALFLISQEEVNGTTDMMEVIHNGNIRSWMTLNFRREWLRIYNVAYSADEQNLHNHLTMILCSLAYHQRALRPQLLNIHFVSRFRSRWRNFPYPICSSVPFVPKNHIFHADKIRPVLRSAAVQFPSFAPPLVATEEQRQVKVREYNINAANYRKELEGEITQLANGVVQACTSTPSFNVNILQDYFGTYILMRPTKICLFSVLSQIQMMMLEWYRNLQLKNFVLIVQHELTKVYTDLAKITRFPLLDADVEAVYVDITPQADKPLDITLATFFNSDKMTRKSVPALIYSNGKFNMQISSDPVEQRISLVFTHDAIFEELKQSVLPNELAKCMDTCGLFPRLVPVYLLRKLVTAREQAALSSCTSSLLPPEILDHIGGIAVLQTHIKRLNRCIKYEGEGLQMATELEREMENRGHENWSPKEHPEWLLLELDLDLMIRPIQVDVATQMIQMPNGGNGVMQLNMGEGKTSLIVPMLVSTLANEDTICRVTVLNSIFKTNLDLLSNAIGGLLNRRVYLVPCRRDARIKDCLSSIWNVYKECMKNRGAVLTLAEYRLSPRLMAYEKLLAKNEETQSFGLDLLELENWLRDHCRDILDESDELLSAKFQLIYTTGAQLSLGGGTMRWHTCQSILRLVPGVLHQLWEKYGDRVVEFDKDKWERYPEQFPPCRLLGDQAQLEFYNLIVEEILEGKANLINIILSTKDRNITKTFLTEPEISKDVHDAVLTIFKDDTELLERILLISGYLRRGILHLALCKRWRVEYGVDYNSRGQQRRQMAVPFRAKDVAAERTEFGHPDVGIVLTHLSYYYSGLKDEQLMETFLVLKAAPGPDSIYHEWISDIERDRLDPSIRSYEGVNLRDFKQRTVHLFPVLRRNKRVIDFWLSNKVFPKESKQFPRKIVTTAWDLCYERNVHATTGFSGTNDCSILLPLPIKQQDLPKLQETNREMEEILKLPENSKTITLPMGVTCRDILQKMRKDNARVLIDAGALMLELGNEQVAHLWLETDNGIEGVAYFNEKNELLVKVRASTFSASSAGGKRRKHGRRVKFTAQDIPLEVSPYRERLDKCAIFLDDQHTRGTDLKFPNGFKGCVTVGSRMKRDKLIQAAMRMRKLGKGHSVVFYLSHEVSNKVHELNGKNSGGRGRKSFILTEDILKWVASNSEDFEKEGLIHWALAGKNYAQKLAAEDMFQYTNRLYPLLSSGRGLKFAGLLGNHCVDEEVVDLSEMYGIHLKHENLIQLLHKWFEIRRQKLEDDRPFPNCVKQVYNGIRDAVVKKCNEYIPERTYLANNFDEEQEKELELEPEHEEIRCMRKQKNLKPLESAMHKDVRDFISGKLFSMSKWQQQQHHHNPSSLVRLSDIFANTTFSNLIQEDCWKCEIFASRDFTEVIKRNNRDKVDNYLRPISYVVSLVKNRKGKRVSHLLLISPYEANELINQFKSAKVHTNAKLHMFSTRCFLGQDILINNPNLQLPTTSNATIIDEQTLAPLLLASGSLFFWSMAEQQAYVRFLGFVPRPWTTNVEQEALIRGWILKTGFLLPKFAKLYEELIVTNLQREEDSDKENNDNDGTVLLEEGKNLVASDLNFQDDPSSMVKAILENRHVALRESAHVIQLLSKCEFVSLVDGEQDEEEDAIEEKVLALFKTMLKLND